MGSQERDTNSDSFSGDPRRLVFVSVVKGDNFVQHVLQHIRITLQTRIIYTAADLSTFDFSAFEVLAGNNNEIEVLVCLEIQEFDFFYQTGSNVMSSLFSMSCFQRNVILDFHLGFKPLLHYFVKLNIKNATDFSRIHYVTVYGHHHH